MLAACTATAFAGGEHRTDWGRIELTRDPQRILLHITTPPQSREVVMPTTAQVVRCVARTEPCALLRFESAKGQITITLPKTLDPLDTIIEVDLAR